LFNKYNNYNSFFHFWLLGACCPKKLAITRKIALPDSDGQQPPTSCAYANGSIPVLLYGLEVCNLSKRDLQSLDFTVNRFFNEIVQY